MRQKVTIAKKNSVGSIYGAIPFNKLSKGVKDLSQRLRWKILVAYETRGISLWISLKVTF